MLTAMRVFASRLFGSFRRRRFDAGIEEEFQSHLQMLADRFASQGMTKAEALRAAKQQFGGVAQIEEELRERSGLAFLDSLWQDLCYGLRVLRKSPGFTAVAVLTLALGIGANTAIFSMIDWLALRPLPVAQAGQLVTLTSELTNGGHYSDEFSYPNLQAIREQSTSVFSEVAGLITYKMDGLSIGGRDEPIWTNYVTSNFFEMLGVKPALGNFIHPASEKSPTDRPVLVLGYSYWKAHFGSDPQVIGKNVLVNGHPVTIIGVAPKGFHGISSLLDIGGYLPLGMAPVTADATKDLATNPKATLGFMIIARMKPRTTLAESKAALQVIAQRLSTEYPEVDKWRNLIASVLDPMGPATDPNAPNPIPLTSALFLVLAGLVLVLACLNVANLLLARAGGRQREMAVRAAVGGERSRLIRQLLTESLLLALFGCAAGIALGLTGSRLISSINLRTDIPLVLDLRFDWRVFAYAFGIALLTALLVGIAPALRATRGDLNNLLHENARASTLGRQRTRSILVVVQVGGSLMLLIVAGLFVRSLRHVEHLNLGFDPNRVLNFTLDPHEAGYDRAQAQDFLNNLIPRLHALPGLETASLAMTVPMGYYSYGMDLKINGYEPPVGHAIPPVGYNAVSPQYFETMRIPILRGRGFLDSDVQASHRVAVINEAMAEKYWHGENAIGRHFVNAADPKQSIEVVGIAKNSRTDGNFSDPIGPYLYVALAQHYDYQIPVTVQLRSNLPLATMNREVIVAIHSLAPAMPVFDIQTMNEALYTINGLMLYQVGAGLAGCLGILGLALAIIGVYGVVSYGASQRTHEIGIRMALGAQPAQILKIIFRQGAFIVGAGVIAGVLAAAAMGRLVGNFLVGVAAIDPLTYISASLLLGGIGLAACYIPAWRAMRVDPMVALRYE